MERESIETRGRTTDEAIRTALAQLQVTREEVEIEVLAEGRSGVFGVGSQEARVRVSLLVDLDEEDEIPRYEAGELPPLSEDDDEEDEEDVPKYADDEVPPLSDEAAEVARETLERMLDLLEFPNVVTVKDIERGPTGTTVALDVAGEDVGLLIGRHGETLRSLQFLLNTLVRKELPRNTRVAVDVEHYRERREQSLRGMALRTADRVRRERRAFTFQAMPPNERRIIHLTLQSSPWVTTESTGEGDERRVVVSPAAADPRRPSYGYRRG